MATVKQINKYSSCLNCKKSIAHHPDGIPHELCRDCRKLLNNENDYEFLLWLQWVNQINSISKEKR